MSEIAKRDANKIPVLLAVRSDNGEVIQVRADSTGALLTVGGGGGTGLTDTQLRATPVPVNVINVPEAWAYYGGASGTVNVTAGQKVRGIAAHATLAGSMTINGGASVPIPANSSIAISPESDLVAPTIIFTGTDSYFIEVVS